MDLQYIPAVSPPVFVWRVFAIWSRPSLIWSRRWLVGEGCVQEEPALLGLVWKMARG